MNVTDLFIISVLSGKRITELERKVRGFENLTKTLAAEVDRQRRENEKLSAQQEPQRLNSFLKVA